MGCAIPPIHGRVTRLGARVKVCSLDCFTKCEMNMKDGEYSMLVSQSNIFSNLNFSHLLSKASVEK